MKSTIHIATKTDQNSNQIDNIPLKTRLMNLMRKIIIRSLSHIIRRFQLNLKSHKKIQTRRSKRFKHESQSINSLKHYKKEFRIKTKKSKISTQRQDDKINGMERWSSG